ncbi:MAG: menaquinone-dependent protoporphyrinogen oxidase [Pseudonocardiales bacterium]|jgi:menaquinone-dependent protoporphyrinogen oxidase|nr:menaquinone-dependent protoporphyrinogen oxidase [Pseudonocardiales bacterium]
MTVSSSPDVLVTYASKMGATAGIAAIVTDELRAHGMAVDVCSVTDVGTVEDYRIVVVGSALYARRWRREAVRFLRRHAKPLSGRTVWMFQSGPCGRDAVHPDQPEPANVARLRDAIGADPPITFGGVLDPATARGFVGRRMARGELAGDFRDPERIRTWAAGIAMAASPDPTA